MLIRVATVNASLYRDRSGELLSELETGKCEQAIALASILQTVRPDIVLINEIDFDQENRCAIVLRDRYIGMSQNGLTPLSYEHLFSAPVNTGIPSNLDLDGDGRTQGAGDAWGFGRYPGQYGMVIYSRLPIETEKARTFQKFLWSHLSGALQPSDPVTGKRFHADAVWRRLRLSSKSHWDVPIIVRDQRLHLLASHPTPPVFDGPEDRNGCRNHDEIAFWSQYIDPASSTRFVDDQGRIGSLGDEQAKFVIVGDLNADPIDGDGRSDAIHRLLSHVGVTDTKPKSLGGREACERMGERNLKHRGDPALDTAEFNAASVGNLRIDYVLPSSNLKVASSGVFWPSPSEPSAQWLQGSDHRLVWVDLAL
ncbi:MAG: endonuclease/exonuclease/phosphatase family protein [Pirellulaceae bacterium]